jgi:phage antirepressor YoqD-like protein
MNELISTNNSLTMSSREIAELTGKQHSHVFRDIRKMLDELEIEHQEYIHIWTHPQNKQSYEEYVLGRKPTDCLLTGYSAKARMKVIDRWHELESRSQFQIPQTLGQALQLAADQAKQLELAAPKVEFVDRFVESTGNKSFREVAKILKANEREFRGFLVNSKVMYALSGDWLAYSRHIAAGRFYTTIGEGNGHAFTATKFTPKGVEYIAGKWIAHKELI